MTVLTGSEPGSTGAEILEEVLRQLRFERQLDAIMVSSVCIPATCPT
jgi:hypothetical protein